MRCRMAGTRCESMPRIGRATRTRWSGASSWTTPSQRGPGRSPEVRERQERREATDRATTAALAFRAATIIRTGTRATGRGRSRGAGRCAAAPANRTTGRPDTAGRAASQILPLSREGKRSAAADLLPSRLYLSQGAPMLGPLGFFLALLLGLGCLYFGIMNQGPVTVTLMP